MVNNGGWYSRGGPNGVGPEHVVGTNLRSASPLTSGNINGTYRGLPLTISSTISEGKTITKVVVARAETTVAWWPPILEDDERDGRIATQSSNFS
ncbi:uncharacterized protein G2W53_026395 [Senna tora]|uniref:Uncharacterized protein n=1 Tax=Senna tora TaxID=362788 RepID=A0A834WF21_9FABA|nr:uncharacterized protein G2W53_026395 [Senna tora]